MTAPSEEELTSSDEDNGEDNGETSDTASAPSPAPRSTLIVICSKCVAARIYRIVYKRPSVSGDGCPKNI